MASEQAWTRGSALILPDRRLALWDAQSTDLTQAGPRAGSPVAQQQGPAHLKASGTQTAGSELRVRTQSPGFPQGRASYVWRRNGDSNWRGWDPPSAISHAEWLDGAWTDGSGDLKWCRNASAAVTGDHTLLVAYDERDDAEASPYRVVVQARNATTGAWGSKVVIYEEATSTREYRPCLLVLPSGRVLCYHFVYQAAEAQVRVQYSDDDGATWAVGSPYALPTALDLSAISLHRIRAAYGGGEVALLIWTDDGSADDIQQYASATNGYTLDLVQADFGNTSAGACDVVWSGEGFVAFYIDDNRYPYAIRLGGAYVAMDITEAVLISGAVLEWCNISGAVLSDANLAAVADETGTIYVYGLHPDASDDAEGEVVRSTNGGASWAALGQGSYSADWGTWFTVEDSATHPDAFCAVSLQGRVVIIGNHAANPGNEDDSIHALYLGGWSSVTMPAFARYPDELTRVCWTHTWVGYDLPDAGPVWTKSGAATPALVSPGDVEINGANTYYYGVPSGTPDEGVIACFAVKTGNGSLTADDVSVLIRAEDGSESYDAVLRFAAGSIRVWDPHAGAQVGSDIDDVEPSGGVVVLVAIDAGSVSVWVRSMVGAKDDREWYEGVVNGSLTDGGAASANRIEWGNRSGTGAASYWRWFNFVSDQWVGATAPDHLAGGQDNPEQLMGRSYSGAGTYTADGVTHVLDDGPTIRADEWYSDTAYDFGVARTTSEEYASPRLSWRSTSTAEQSIALKWDDTANTYPSDVIAVAMYGHNIPKIKVELHNGSTWAYSQTITLGHSIAYTRLGTEVHPASGGSAEPFLNRHEAAGWTMVLTDATTTKARRVTSNPQGKWTSDTTRRTMLKLAGVDGTEGNTNTAGLLVPSSCVILIPTRGVPYKAVRLTPIAPSAATDPEAAEDYWEIGTLVVGEFVPNPEPYSWGRYMEIEPGTTLEEQRDRTRRGNAQAPARRSVTYGFVDGDALVDLLGIEADPDFIEADAHASAVPVGVKGGALYNHEGIYRELDGPGDVLSYLAAVDEIGASDAYSLILDPEAHMLGRVVSGPYRVDVVVGNELEDELVRGTEWTISEEV